MTGNVYVGDPAALFGELRPVPQGLPSDERGRNVAAHRGGLNSAERQ